MLGVDDQVEVELVVPAWESIVSRSALPVEVDEFLDKDGPMPIKHDSQRGFHRMYMRIRAITHYDGEFRAIYLSDISRTGVGFFSPVQLLPCSKVQLWLANGQKMDVVLKTCLRVQEQCYRCGVEFLKDQDESE